MATIRQQRVADLLFQELSIMISTELEDPRISYVDVTRVDISRDLRNAKAYVFHRDDEVTQKEIMKGLRAATPYMRRQIAQRCGLRSTPELIFFYDDTPERAARIDELLRMVAQDGGGSDNGGLDEQEPDQKNAEEAPPVDEQAESANSSSTDILSSGIDENENG